jgi:hypothetical protein
MKYLTSLSGDRASTEDAKPWPHGGRGQVDDAIGLGARNYRRQPPPSISDFVGDDVTPFTDVDVEFTATILGEWDEGSYSVNGPSGVVVGDTVITPDLPLGLFLFPVEGVYDVHLVIVGPGGRASLTKSAYITASEPV